MYLSCRIGKMLQRLKLRAILGIIVLVGFSLYEANSKPIVLLGEPFKNESKKMAKTLKDEGWKVFGDKSLKEALDAHYKALGSNSNLMVIEGVAKAGDINQAIRKSQNYAARQYASMRETNVEGSTETHSSNTSGENPVSNIQMDMNYQSSTSQTVKALVPSVTFYRTLSNGWVEVRALFLVDTLK